jgi:zinc/manganese transport system substrate-binding protein
LAAVGLVVALTAPAAAQSPSIVVPADDRLDVVVTTTILGAVVSDLVGDRADVQVLMQTGTDPHEWQPSAQDIEAVHAADLVVENGLGLEESLADALDEARAAGTVVFTATDAIEVRMVGPDDPAADDGPADPHFWTDPLRKRDVVDALAPVVSGLGVDVADLQADLDARLDALDASIRSMVATIPEDRRKLVTGHESMGYYADEYGFTLVGAVLPSLSSEGEVSAQELAALADRIREQGVTVVFSEIGTPQAVVDAIASETGARVVALPSHNLPADASYQTFILDITDAIVAALGA